MHSESLRRILGNAGWFLGGRGIGAVLSLVYLGIATRALGVEGFGQFSLILGTGQAISVLMSFQSWQIVVRYGTEALHSGAAARLNRLTGFCFLLDLSAAIAGALLSVLAVQLLKGPLGWSPELARSALIFCIVLLFCLESYAVGILRLHNRFDAVAAAETLTPIVRFIGALVVWWFEAGITGFLAAWALSNLMASLGLWLLSTRLIRPAGWVGDWRGLAAVAEENPGLWRFTWLTNAAMSLNLVARQGAVLLIGLWVGAAAAGGYRLAFQLGQGLAKLTQAVSRAAFPELMRIRTAQTLDDFDLLFRQMNRVALIVGVLMIALMLLAGRPLLTLIAGPGYESAYPLLLLIGGAAIVDLAAVGFQPALLALGKPATALVRQAGVTAVMLLLMFVLTRPVGAEGPAWATLAGALLGYVVMRAAAKRALARRRAERPEEPLAPAQSAETPEEEEALMKRP